MKLAVTTSAGSPETLCIMSAFSTALASSDWEPSLEIEIIFVALREEFDLC